MRDAQHATGENIERPPLRDQEIEDILGKIGTYINCYDAMELAITGKRNTPS